MWTVARHPYRDVREGQVFCDAKKKDVAVEACMNCPRLVSFTGSNPVESIRCWMPRLAYFAEV